MSEAVQERTTLPTLYEWQARQIEEAAKNVAFWVSTTPEDKLSWQPKAEGHESKARTIYDQIHECAQVNRRFGNLLRGIENGPWVPDPNYASSVEAQADLKASAAEIAAVIRILDDGALRRDYPTKSGSMTGAFIISLILGNMNYHGGQINQIQLLLGDDEFRFPED
ncbi:MAG: DinB family protein [Fimbriimonadales bacterium]